MALTSKGCKEPAFPSLPYIYIEQVLEATVSFYSSHFLILGKKGSKLWLLTTNTHTFGREAPDAAEQDVCEHIQEEPISSISLWVTHPARPALPV